MVEAVSGRPHKERDRAKCKGGERQFARFSQHRQEGRGCGLPGSVYPVAPRYDGSFGATRSRSKKTLRAAEQERADVARARRRWMREQGKFDPARLVFIDEIRQHQDGAAVRPLRPRRAAGGACAAGPLEDHHFRGRAARRHDRKEFLAYVERCLAPTLRPKDLVMIDNLPAHETPRIVSCDLASVIVRPY